jgi:two-component system OmpR family sensor kinase
MFRSLRFRLPALFLLGVVFAGLVSTAVSIRLFQTYTRDRTVKDLRRESLGLLTIYQGNAGTLRGLPTPKVEQAVGDRIFYVPLVKGFSLFPGGKPRLESLPLRTVDVHTLAGPRTIQFRHRGVGYVGVVRLVKLQKQRLGGLVVARPLAALRNGWLTLTERLAISFAVALAVSALLAVYFSRRISSPLRQLSAAADEIAAGNYAIDLPEVASGDEIAHLAERFRQMAARLAETEQIERNFLMSVSHELRTPLTAIRGHVAALREGVFRDPEVREESLAVVAMETERLERLVQDVLDLAKLDVHRFTLMHEEVNMGTLVERAYSAFAEEARRRSIEYREDVRARPVLVTDGDRVLQIISNLLSNAFRWTPEGGRVELALSQENGSVSVDVADTGPGIAAAERERIFRPFWSRDDGGTGLGLAIAHELAAALGGRIELESEPGHGSTFRLVLPAGPGASD